MSERKKAFVVRVWKRDGIARDDVVFGEVWVAGLHAQGLIKRDEVQDARTVEGPLFLTDAEAAERSADTKEEERG